MPAATTTADEATAQGVSLALLGFASFIVTANTRTVDLLLPIIANDFSTTVGQAAIVTSAYTLPYGVCQLFYGPLGDRVGKVRVMTVALAAFAISTAACALAPGLLWLVALRLFSGGTAAAMIPLSMAYIADHAPYAVRQATLARFLAALALGQVLGASISGIISQYAGWRGVFVFYGVAAAFAWIALVRGTRSTRAEELARQGTLQPGAGQLSLAAYWRLLQAPAAQVVIGAVFIEGVFLFGGLAYLGASLRVRHHLPLTTIGLLLGGFGLGGLLYSQVAGRLVRRIGESGMILLGGSIAMACYLAVAPAGIWQLFALINIILGLGYNLMHATLQTKATELAPGARGTAIALFAFSLFLGQAIGATLLGRIVDGAGYPATFVVSGAATGLLAIWLAWIVRRQNRQASALAAVGQG